MMNRWIMTVMAGAAISLSATTGAEAQGASAAARARQQERQTEQDRRAAERDQQRAARDAAAQRDSRAANQRSDARDRADARSASDRQREAERERLRLERERQAERDRLVAQRQRQAELDRIAAERRRQAELDRLAAERRRQAERDRMYGSRGGYYWDDYRGWNDNGPAFCRAGGSGHPVFGRDWCRDKGYGMRYDRWDRDGWGDIDTRRRRGRDQNIGRVVLIDILGDVIYRRFESYGRQYYGSGPMTGDWFVDRGTPVLQLSIGGVPFARLVDNNRNGRIDNVLLRR